MTPDRRDLAERIVAADGLFMVGEFAECYRLSHDLLDEAAGADVDESWQVQLLGLIGKSALHISRLDEALDTTREALQRVQALDDAALDPLIEGYRENLLTVLAALEPQSMVGDGRQPLAHRMCRHTILRAQTLTDRFRFTSSISVLEPLHNGLSSLLIEQGGRPTAEPADVRVWYLPRVLGLLGFNWLHLGELPRATALTVEALDASRILGDRTGQRIYQANLAIMGADWPGA